MYLAWNPTVQDKLAQEVKNKVQYTVLSCLYYLARNPTVQDKLAQEVKNKVQYTVLH